MQQRQTGILLNYLCEGVKILTALVYTPVMLRLLGQGEYGLYQLVSAVVSNLGLLSFGFGGAYVRYYSRYQVNGDREGAARLNGMFLLVFCFLSALCLLCGGWLAQNAALVFGSGLSAPELRKAKVLLLILVINMALTFPGSVFDCCITAQEQFRFQKLLRLGQSVLNPFLTLPLLLMGYGSAAVAAVSLALTIAVFLTNAIYCRKKLKIAFSFQGLQFSLLKEIGVFTFFIFLNQIIDQINWSVDKFLLGRMSGTVSVAVYGVGGQINALYVQMSTAVSAVFAPKIHRIVARSDDNGELTRLMAKVGRVQLWILALLLSGFCFFGRAFLRLWAGEGYEDSYIVALLLMVPMTVPLIQNLGIEIQRAKNRHCARSVVYACLAVGNIVLSIFLIRRWDCVGAAAGTAITQAAGTILFMNWYYHRKIGLNMAAFWREMAGTVPALLAACLFGGIYSSCVAVGGWGSLLGSAFLYTLAYCAVVWRWGLNAEEKRYLLRMFASGHADQTK